MGGDVRPGLIGSLHHRAVFGRATIAISLLPTIARADPCEDRLRRAPEKSSLGRFATSGWRQPLRGQLERPLHLDRGALVELRRPKLHGPGGRRGRDRSSALVSGRSLNCVAVRGRSGRVGPLSGLRAVFKSLQVACATANPDLGVIAVQD